MKNQKFAILTLLFGLLQVFYTFYTFFSDKFLDKLSLPLIIMAVSILLANASLQASQTTKTGKIITYIGLILGLLPLGIFIFFMFAFPGDF